MIYLYILWKALFQHFTTAICTTLRRKQGQPQSLKRLQNQKRSASAAGGGQNLWWYPIDTLTLDIQTYWYWYWTNEHLLSVRNIHGRWPAVEMKLAHMKVPQCFNDEMCVSVFMFPLVLWVSEWNADHMFIAVRKFFSSRDRLKETAAKPVTPSQPPAGLLAWEVLGWSSFPFVQLSKRQPQRK